MLAQFTQVWNEVVTFLVSLFPSIEGVFYNADTSSLTFIGVMAVVMAGVALILLVKFVDPAICKNSMQTA